MGRGGIEPPVSETAGLQPAAPHGATDPCAGPVGAGPDDDASAVVKVLVSRLVAGRGAGSEGVEPPVVGFGDRDATTGSSPKKGMGMTLCACAGEALDFGAERCALPAHDGPAGIGRFPSSRLRLMIETHGGLARIRAEARQGLPLEQRLGGEDACHRSDDGEPTAQPCQRNFRGRRNCGRTSFSSSALP